MKASRDCAGLFVFALRGLRNVFHTAGYPGPSEFARLGLAPHSCYSSLVENPSQVRRATCVIVALVVHLALPLIAPGNARAKTVTLQQGSSGFAGCTDSWIRTWYGNTSSSSSYIPPKNQDDNYGSVDYLDIRYYYSLTCPKCPKITRIVIRFDISSIPAGSNITSALLQLKVKLNLTKSPLTMHAYRITDRWEEGQVSWIGRTLSADWAKKGGDYASTALDKQIEKPAGQWISWDITAAVKGWKESGVANRGVLIRTPENTGTGYGYTDPEGKMYQFHSSEASVVMDRPKLVITYAVAPVKDAGGSTTADAAGADGSIQTDSAAGVDVTITDAAVVDGDESSDRGMTAATDSVVADGKTTASPGLTGSSGCDCSVEGSDPRASVLTVLALLLLWRRRRRSQF